MGGKDYVKSVTKKLLDNPDLPEDEQRTLAELLLVLVSSRQEKDSASIASILKVASDVATRLGDADLWCRAMTVCGGDKKISRLGEEGLVSALRCFPKDVILSK